MAGLKRDCSLPGKTNVLHALVVGSSPACSNIYRKFNLSRSYNDITWVCNTFYDGLNPSLLFSPSSEVEQTSDKRKVVSSILTGTK